MTPVWNWALKNIEGHQMLVGKKVQIISFPRVAVLYPGDLGNLLNKK